MVVAADVGDAGKLVARLTSAIISRSLALTAASSSWVTPMSSLFLAYQNMSLPAATRSSRTAHVGTWPCCFHGECWVMLEHLKPACVAV